MADKLYDWNLGISAEDLTKFDGLPGEIRPVDPTPRPKVRFQSRKPGAPKGAAAPKRDGVPERPAEIQGRDDALQDSQRPSPVSEQDRLRAISILDEIGTRFAENRRKGKSTAFEQYQRDLAVNMQYLITGGVMNLKEISQTLMQLEEFRKQTSEHGKSPATLLGEWLSGSALEGE